MLACISKNDRGEPLFSEVVKLVPHALRLGCVTPSRGAKLLGAMSSLSSNLQQIRSDMQFSPFLARAGQTLTEKRLRQAPGATHVLQWGATYAPVRHAQHLSYSIVTDGPFNPEDDLYPMEWKPRRWAAEYFVRQCEIYRKAALVFTLSEWARQQLLRLHILDPKRVVRIGWGPMFEAEASSELMPSKLFVSIGNEWRRKGMDVVARAGTRLHGEDGEVETVIVGDPAGMRVAEADGVTLLPRRLATEEVKSLLRRARALVIASRFDASPHIVMEALQMGVPVIGSNVCGIQEAVKAPLGGRVVPAGEENDLLDAMREMLHGPPILQRVGALSAYAASGGWTAAARRVVDALTVNGVV